MCLGDMMEFNEKLQNLRRQSGMTQEQLANKLYVSRTAISKWESGRGYPNIESLKAISRLFSVSLDELLSADEALELANEEGKERLGRLRDIIYGLSDISVALLLFLPLFADRAGDVILPSSLLGLESVQLYLRILYFTFVSLSFLMGVMILSLQSCKARLWTSCKSAVSLGLGGVGTLLFILSLQPYAAVFVFMLLAIKAVLLIKRQ